MVSLMLILENRPPVVNAGFNQRCHKNFAIKTLCTVRVSANVPVAEFKKGPQVVLWELPLRTCLPLCDIQHYPDRPIKFRRADCFAPEGDY